MAFIDKVRAWWRTASMLEALIAINVVVFVVLRLIMTAQLLFNVPGDGLMRWVELPSQPATLLSRPWTLITYMFAHVDFLHILFNMLWFYWLGRIFMDYFHPKQLASLYVMGGLGGAALYLLAYNLLPVFSHQPSFLLGASASILAIVVATAAYVPDRHHGAARLLEHRLGQQRRPHCASGRGIDGPMVWTVNSPRHRHHAARHTLARRHRHLVAAIPPSQRHARCGTSDSRKRLPWPPALHRE